MAGRYPGGAPQGLAHSERIAGYMAHPSTYLLTCPDKAVNQLGQSMMSSDIIFGLRRINNNIVVPEPDESNWKPRKVHGMTALWYGKPRGEGSTLISGIHLGAVPEYTQIDDTSGPSGEILMKGWREIFSRVIRRTPVTQIQIEREFHISLEVTGASNNCTQCAKEGIHEQQNGGKRGLCDMHDSVQETVETVTDEVLDNRYTLKQGQEGPPRLPS